MYKVFIVEDNVDIANSIKNSLERWNFKVELCDNFNDVKNDFLNSKAHIILMDINLPFYNGYHWTSEVRKTSNVPIIFLSSSNEKLNIVMAMEMGADDFISKPFEMEILVAKIKALLRRSYDYENSIDIIEYKGLILNLKSMNIIYEEEKNSLSKNEFKILEALLLGKGDIISRESLMNHLWNTDIFIDDNTLSVNISRLRKSLSKIGLDDFIKTKTGVGYYV